MLFSRQPKPVAGTVSSSEFDALQASSDQVLDAPEFLDRLFDEWQSRGVHPWHGEPAEHMQAALAALAYTTDRTAEIMKEHGQVTDGKGHEWLLEDVEGFAVPLADTAKQLLAGATAINPGYMEVDFDDETRGRLHPESQLPYWPQTSRGSIADWQAETGPAVTPQFIKGVIAAGDELFVQSYGTADRYQTQTIGAIPPEYADFINEVGLRSEEAHAQLEQAKTVLFHAAGATEVNPQLYESVHDGYIDIALGFVALHAPEVVGWDPERPDYR